MDPLYFPRWMEVLIAIARLPPSQRYPQKLYRTCPSCASHIKTLLKVLQAHDLIRINPRGHIRWIRLTRQGQTLSQHLMQVRWCLASVFHQENLKSEYQEVASDQGEDGTRNGAR